MWRSTKFSVIQAHFSSWPFQQFMRRVPCVQNSTATLFTNTLHMKCTAFTVYKKMYSVLSVFKCIIHSFIHSLVFSLRGRAGRNQSPVMWPVWLWHTASWASSWGYFVIAFRRNVSYISKISRNTLVLFDSLLRNNVTGSFKRKHSLNT